jgi:two-component system, chemotaxis family, chemotaxis protein CheY
MGKAPERGKTILVVEDDPLTREALGALLGGAGYTARAAAEGGEALEVLRQGPPPDLILLDLLMPGMDGWHFRREQQHDPALATIPVVVCSGTGDADLHAAALGAIGFIDKPIDPDQLLDTIHRALGPARA